EPAIVLESAGISGRTTGKNPLVLETEENSSGTMIIRTPKIFVEVIELLQMGENPHKIAFWVQEALAEALLRNYLGFIREDSILPLVLSGGVSYNSILFNCFTSFFKRNQHVKEYKFMTNRELPPGDGGISAGQIVIGMNKCC
ncbi:MAG: hypothetical protein ACFFD4_25005, partial [Candidatus Odinarchaeota archaeon]